MVGKGNLAVFESNGISKSGEVTPTKIGVHACYINVYIYEFFEPILLSMVGKGNLVIFESNGISESGDVTPTKIGVHVCYINVYIHEFFDPIPID